MKINSLVHFLKIQNFIIYLKCLIKFTTALVLFLFLLKYILKYILKASILLFLLATFTKYLRVMLATLGNIQKLWSAFLKKSFQKQVTIHKSPKNKKRQYKAMAKCFA